MNPDYEADPIRQLTSKGIIMNKSQELLEELNRTDESKPSLEDTFQKIKDWDAKALAGFARKAGLPDDVVDPIKRDSETLMAEILGHLYGEDWEYELINKGLL